MWALGLKDGDRTNLRSRTSLLTKTVPLIEYENMQEKRSRVKDIDIYQYLKIVKY